MGRSIIARVIVAFVVLKSLLIKSGRCKKKDGTKWGCLTSGSVSPRRAFVFQYCLTFDLLSVKHKSSVVIQDSQICVRQIKTSVRLILLMCLTKEELAPYD